MIKKGTAGWVTTLITLAIALVVSPIALAYMHVASFAVELLITLELTVFLPMAIILLAFQKMNWDTVEFVMAYDIWLSTRLHALEREVAKSEKSLDDLAIISRAMLLRMIDKKKAVVDPDAPIKVFVRND